MIGAFITFLYGDNFDEEGVRRIAETARGGFEGMPGLRSKAFAINSGKREATNCCVWDSADAAKTFFTDELVERITGLYGVRPSTISRGRNSVYFFLERTGLSGYSGQND
jgi:hypothetical protein